jgi:hypothetical protein
MELEDVLFADWTALARDVDSSLAGFGCITFKTPSSKAGTGPPTSEIPVAGVLTSGLMASGLLAFEMGVASTKD